MSMCMCLFFKQKTAYEMRISDWSSDVCSSDLALGAVFAGFIFHHGFIDVEGNFWNGSIAFDAHLMHAMHEVPLWVKLSPAAVMLLGLFLAWNSYIRNPALPGAFVAQFRGLYAFLLNKWYFDERSEEHTSELKSLMRTSYAVFC